jgi:tRNA (cmo5U34)-methyltransferase
MTIMGEPSSKCENARMTDTDQIYREATEPPEAFVFDDRVVRVFPDMINRSVPGYGLVVPMMGMLARRYATEGSVLYDLGCSLGAVALAMQAAIGGLGVRIIAVDNAPGMIERLEQTLAERGRVEGPVIEPKLQDLRETRIENASVVALNFTLQFVPPGQRLELMQRIRQGMNEEAVLLLSEKIAFDDPEQQALLNAWHHDFKRSQGYSDLEIARKRDALEHVMIPESLEKHRQRLQAAGFGRTVLWYQGFNFVSMLAFA